jgi:hypothetical protein
MNSFRLKGRASPNSGVTAPDISEAIPQADSLVDRAQEAEREQTLAVENAPVADQYSSALASEVEAKHDQVSRIEDRLENLIENQAARLQTAQARPPGFLSRPGARAAWQAQLQQQQATLQRLQSRLEVVREIKEGMGVAGPKLEELAARKLRHREPELVEGWDELREAQRRHEAIMRKKDRDEKNDKRLGKSRSQSQTITFTTAPR